MNKFKQFDWFNRVKFKKMVGLRKPKPKLEKFSCIQCIHFITYRKFFPNGGAGGAGGVMSANKIILGENYGDREIKYSFKDRDYYKHNVLKDVWGAYYFVAEKTRYDNPETIYITHDHETAFALFLLGKNYAVVSHLQGCRLDEIEKYSSWMSPSNKRIIKLAEYISFRKANFVCFPSSGAKEEFLKSKNTLLRDGDFLCGPTLYNTLYSFSAEDSVSGIDVDKNVITLLSIGQLNGPKGMDRLSKFYDKLSSSTDKNIRAILVGKGPDRDRIISDLSIVRDRNKNFSYFHLNSCSYSEIQYLQNISDIYVMLHRVSIFDLSTLEVMKKGKCIVLSKVGGNLDFDKDNNVIFVDEDNIQSDIILKSHLENGAKNKSVYERFFSPEQFAYNYKKLIDSFISMI